MSSRSDITQSIASVERKPADCGIKGDLMRPYRRGGRAMYEAAAELLALLGRNGQIDSVFEMHQAFFLIDRGWYGKRTDLMLTGRALVGAPSPKAECWRRLEDEDRCGDSINNERVLNYLNDVIAEGDKKNRFIDFNGDAHERLEIGVDMGAYEGAAPNQYVFFQKQIRGKFQTYTLLTDIMEEIALRHNLVCLPHEKPFAGVNANGRSIIWSLLDENDKNLFEAGGAPEDKLIFLTLAVSVMHAAHRHGDLLRAVAASAGSEERLSGSEDPSAAVSVSLGEQLTKIIAMIAEKGKRCDLAGLGRFAGGGPAPVCFTGDGFAFRMTGGSMTIWMTVTVINTIVADSIKTICERIKKELNKNKGNKQTADADNGSGQQGDADPRKQDIMTAAVLNVLSAVIKESKSVLFDGGGSSEPAKEARARGPQNTASAPEALKALIAPKTVELFGRRNVFSEAELKALYNDRLDRYDKTLDAEVKTLTDIVNTQVLPAAYNYQTDIASGLEVLRVLADDMTIEMTDGALEDRKEMFEKLTDDIYRVRKNLKELAAMADKARGMEIGERAAYLSKEIKPQMELVRRYVDALEGVMPDELWPLPKYKEMLFIL